jgi:uncharacterized membrane protein
MLAIAWLSGAGPRQTSIAAAPPAADVAAAHGVILSRCSMCHMNEPIWLGVHSPPKDVLLDDTENMRRHARLIDINAVRSHAMPPGNITEITDQERQIIGAWIAAGAPGE